MLRRKCANSPPTKEIIPQQPVGGALDEALIDNRGGDAMSRIRTCGSDLFLMRIEPHRNETFFLHPESVIEPLLQLLRFMIEPLRFVFAIQPPKQFRDVQLCQINKSLFLTCRNWRLHL